MSDSGNGTEGKVALLDPERSRRLHADSLTAPWRDGLPYDRERVIAWGKFHLERQFQSAYEVGKCLFLLSQYETVQTYAQILKEQFGDMPRRTAYNYMRFARFCGSFPRFRAVFERPRMVYKGMALLEGLKDPEAEELLAGFEETGNWGDLQEEDIVTQSVRQLKRENKRLREQKEKETEAWERERERLQEKILTLEEALGESSSLAAQRRIFEEINRLLDQVVELFRRLDKGLVQTDEAYYLQASARLAQAERLLGGVWKSLLRAEDVRAEEDEGHSGNGSWQ